MTKQEAHCTPCPHFTLEVQDSGLPSDHPPLLLLGAPLLLVPKPHPCPVMISPKLPCSRIQGSAWTAGSSVYSHPLGKPQTSSSVPWDRPPFRPDLPECLPGSPEATSLYTARPSALPILPVQFPHLNTWQVVLPGTQPQSKHVLGACLSPHLIYQPAGWLCCLGCIQNLSVAQVPHPSPSPLVSPCLPRSTVCPQPHRRGSFKDLTWLTSPQEFLTSPGAKVILTKAWEASQPSPQPP